MGDRTVEDRWSEKSEMLGWMEKGGFKNCKRTADRFLRDTSYKTECANDANMPRGNIPVHAMISVSVLLDVCFRQIAEVIRIMMPHDKEGDICNVDEDEKNSKRLEKVLFHFISKYGNRNKHATTPLSLLYEILENFLSSICHTYFDAKIRLFSGKRDANHYFSRR